MQSFVRLYGLRRSVLLATLLVLVPCSFLPLGSQAMRSSSREPAASENAVAQKSRPVQLGPEVSVVPTTLHFHGNVTDDAGCSGVGNADNVLCGGPFLLPKSTLAGFVASAHWNIPDPELDGATDQNTIDPNWIWTLSSPTTVGGDMALQWWASCNSCGPAPLLQPDWTIRLWADGTKVFEQQLTNLTPLGGGNVPEKFNATVTIPTITANNKLVLQIDPKFLNAQIETRVYYDSQQPCPLASGSAPCDSQVIMPVLTGVPSPSPTPTPTGSPTPAPSVHSGTLSPSNPELVYIGGPFSTSNPLSKTTDTPPGCTASTPCDQFVLHIDIPPDDPNTYMANATVSWTNSGTTTQGNSTSDFDLYAYKPDAPSGQRVAESASQNNPEAVSFLATAGDYTVYAIPYDVSPSVQMVGTITLVRVNEAPSPTPTPSPTATPLPTPTVSVMGFSSATYTATEACTATTITVLRSGLNNGITKVEYLVSDAAANQHGDYEFASGVLTFNPGETSKSFNVLLNEDSYFEGQENATITLKNVSGGIVGAPAQATLDIDDNDTGPQSVNVIDDANNFVGQHYHDFLNRQAEPDGQAYWASQITACGSDKQCVLSRRIGVSAAFFIEQEFQQTAFYVYRIFNGSLGRRPTYVEFMTDWSRLAAGSNLDTEQADYSEDFVQRSEHSGKYPAAMSEASYVDSLIQNVLVNSGVDLSSHRSELMSEYDAGTSQMDSRARTVRKLIEYPEFTNAEYNRAFVLAQYFNYLRREPEEAGYQFWLNILNNSDPNNYRGMVCAFITSDEYQQRFGSSVSYHNSDCAP
jgi:hypothetical protein